MRALVPLLVLCGGCKVDPTFFGYWDILELERDGVVQDDAGFFEVLDNSSMALFLRYDWAGGAFVPDPNPVVILGETDAVQPEIFDNYSKKGEVHTILLGPFGVPFLVEEYTGDEAVVTAPDALWPGDPTATALPTTLVLRR